MKWILPVCLLFLSINALTAQNLPPEMHFSADGKRLITGGNIATGFYNETTVDTIELVFPQTNYLSLLASNYSSDTEIPATLIYKGETFDSVGVSYKGFTSYSMNNSQKKSFSITLDKYKNYDIEGYESLNLNCNFEDHTAMHEVLYSHIGRNYIPEVKANYKYLKINGAPWAIYTNAQQLDGNFIKEWFPSNDGIRWRAIKPGASTGGGGGGGGGSPFGTGFSTLNYLGADTTIYKTYYTLKSSTLDQPWTYLRDVTYALNNMPLATMPDSLKYYLDVDKALWFLAHEIIFADDDSYVWKGGMDYFVYYEPESGTLTPLEFDGNSAFWPQGATWSIFYNENDVRFPLMNRLFKVPEFRQRYLAHVRTILKDYMTIDALNATIDQYKALIDDMVKNEPKKIYTYAQFTASIPTLKTWIANRRTFLLSNTEVAQVPPSIASVTRSAGGVVDAAPIDGQQVLVNAAISSASGIKSVFLYHSDDLIGIFNRVEMFDDGAHSDGAASDGVYGASIPGYSSGTFVRYYVEARANNAAGSAAFMPEGAEHDVFVYYVTASVAAGDVVINELMASNATTAKDENDQYEDWIELYNKGNSAINLSGYYLTDNLTNLTKWDFPTGTTINPGEYLIVWADEDSSQGPLHANFKLSAAGEFVYLLNTNVQIVDSVSFGQQTTDRGYARVPNGTGSFVIQAPTFAANNNVLSDYEPLAARQQFLVYPNPAYHTCIIEGMYQSSIDRISLVDVNGRLILDQQYAQDQKVSLPIDQLSEGLYLIKINGGQAVQKLVVMKK